MANNYHAQRDPDHYRRPRPGPLQYLDSAGQSSPTASTSGTGGPDDEPSPTLASDGHADKDADHDHDDILDTELAAVTGPTDIYKRNDLRDSSSTSTSHPTTKKLHSTTTPPPQDDVDNVSDTVGAIAIDRFGNIAAGSSSGGIGMKHRGRIGPAALVGIGTAVIPMHPGDPERKCVATVTSGTGEHIATTLAASTCASRLYNPQQRRSDGTYEDSTEEEAMRKMIETEFMREHYPLCFKICI